MILKTKKYTLLLILLIIPLAGAGVDIHVPSLPSILLYFNATSVQIKYSVTIYLLGYGLGQFIVGSLSDSFGRRSLLLPGLILYALICLFSIYSTSIMFFLITRFLQGIIVAGPAIAIKACISDNYQGKELEKVSSLSVIAWACGPILAPFIGGYLQHFFEWKACFIFLCIYSSLLFVVALFFLPESKTDMELLNLSNMSKNYALVMKNRPFWGCAIITGITYSIMAVFNVMGPFLLQVTLGYSSITFGHIAMILGFSFFIGGILNRYFVAKISMRKIFIIATSIWCISQIIVFLITLKIKFTLISLLIPLCIIFVLGGIIQPTVFSIVLGLFPKLGGTVNSILGIIVMTITALATTIASHLGTLNLLPLMFFYLVLAFVCLLTYFTFIKNKS